RPAGDRAAERIELAREADRLARDVAAQARFDRGLAVAEDVVRDADARSEILPARKVGLLVEMTRRHERACGKVLRLQLRVEIVEAQAEIECELVHRPLILRKDAEVRVQPLPRVARRS